MDWFIRRANIKHHRALLKTTVDKAGRQRIKVLLAEEEAKGLERVMERRSSFPTGGIHKGTERLYPRQSTLRNRSPL